MWTDFLLLVSAGTIALKLAFKHWISAEEASVFMLAAVLFVGVTRVFGSSVFRDKSRGPKIFVSVISFAASMGDGDVQLTLLCAALCLCVGVAAFPLYFMISKSAPDKSMKIVPVSIVVFFAVGILWWLAEEVKRQSGSETFSISGLWHIFQQRAYPSRSISIRVPSYGTSEVFSTNPLYGIIRWNIEDMRGIAMHYADGRQVFDCQNPWPSMVNTSGATYRLFFKSCRNVDAVLTLTFE